MVRPRGVPRFTYGSTYRGIISVVAYCVIHVPKLYYMGCRICVHMSEVTVEDPIRHRTDVIVQDDGRVSVGRDYAGEHVNIIVERADDE